MISWACVLAKRRKKILKRLLRYKQRMNSVTYKSESIHSRTSHANHLSLILSWILYIYRTEVIQKSFFSCSHI